ncbi:cell growth regulator with EF hand domain protein 1-like [Oncorhynchus kisutch]|uniref:Cell growth regulator with EF-hand domain 1 n=2 Tax=Oncorhynchus kisutch TaxID=8019 RepID=A0A8C7KME1_ONCKI|nr:cell growth regulator with EF hand domain protein 1-like [Oncorhynchus kisutch]
MRFSVYSSNGPSGASLETGADMLVTGVLSLLLLAHQCVSAPQVPGDQRVESAGAPPPLTLANPFGSGDEERRLLQSYIKANLKEGQGGPDSTWEQEVFFLFSLHDYDRSGDMDGLEMMRLLSEYNSHNRPGEQSAEPVVDMVDFLLQTQDLNMDGLIAPPELLSPPKLQQPDSYSQGAPEQGGSVAQEQVNVQVEVKVVDEPKLEKAAQKERNVEEQPKEEESKPRDVGQEVKTNEHPIQAEEKGLHIPEAPAADHEQNRPAPVHQGQPEM